MTTRQTVFPRSVERITRDKTERGGLWGKSGETDKHTEGGMEVGHERKKRTKDKERESLTSGKKERWKFKRA